MIDQQLVLTVAARAGVCQRTAQRALQGQPIRGLAGGRVHRALVELGLRPNDEPGFGPGHGAQSITSVGWHGGPR